MTKICSVTKVNAVSRDSAFYDETRSRYRSINVDCFRVESSDHRPDTEVILEHDNQVIGVSFRVRDRYVKVLKRDFQGAVHLDSCVEFFVRPAGSSGYFNFEVNCGGALHASFIEDWRRIGDGFAKRTPLTRQQADAVSIRTSLPQVIDPEMDEAVEWFLTLRIPLIVMETFVGSLGSLSGAIWTGNFHKCGDETSHPHWASWSPIPELNFHCPDSFGTIRFD